MIPVVTLYYFLCYAWNRLPEPAVLQASEATPFHRPLGLLAQVLLHGTRRLLRAGLPRTFQPQEAELTSLRGRIELAPSLGRGLLERGRAICTFDELSPNSPLHRLLAHTLGSLANAAELPLALRRELSQTRQRFPASVTAGNSVPPTAATFRELRRQRLSSQAAFLLHVCELVWQIALPEPTARGRNRFADFRRDEALMARLFEQFTRNFFRREQRRYRVYAETIAWQADGQTDDLALLPTMLTDTTLEAFDRKIILDTKYYAAALRPRYDRQRLIAPHLYQLYAYLQNQRPAPGQALEGILLYPAGHGPAATQNVDVRYTLGGHPVRVVTLNLHQPWPGIAADLLRLVE
ncbi:5-methylcytosine restriction system specificity protein McrC [Hymenobacter sp. B1770]|uniref:5-methylcytosine restriction system specificity protein McrC n=1 Tax=Hymenobacter sp. B1770 TaxID=1718788 RepID=UPI003CEB72F9